MKNKSRHSYFNFRNANIILNKAYKNIPHYKIYILFVFFISASFMIKAQTLYPDINNYSYASNQNWDIDISNDHVVFVANHSGLSRYNGQSWSLLELPEKMIVRSVFCDEDLIYTGSYEEFGFWKNDDFGKLKYHSLQSKFQDFTLIKSEEFWQILKFENRIIFRSFGAIYIYDGEIIKRISPGFDISSMAIHNKKLLIGSLSGGLYELNEENILPYEPFTIGQKIKSVSHIASKDNMLFINDSNSGCYIFRQNSLELFPEKINTLVKNNVLNKIKFIDNKTIAFGTIKNGIIIYSIENRNIQIISKENGLKNNTVLGLKVSENYLWVALDNGISRIDLNSEFEYYYDKTGQLGTVYDIVYFEGKYILASNTGVYTFKEDELELIANSEGHTWQFFIIDNTLFCAHNNGTYKLNENKLERVDGSFSGVYGYFSINENVFQATYFGIGLLKDNGTSLSVAQLEGLDVPIDKIVSENDSILWATHPYKGLYKLNFDAAAQRVKTIIDYSKNTVIKKNKVTLQKINNTVYFVINNRWYTYSKTNDSFQLFDKLDNKKLIGQSAEDLWFIEKESPSTLINYASDFKVKSKVINDKLFSRFVKGYEKWVNVNDSLKLINLNDGFALFHQNKIKKQEKVKPVIDFIRNNNNYFKTPDNTPLQFTNKQAKSINVSVYIPGSFESNLAYSLEGVNNQTEEINKGLFTLKNISAGDYVLNIYEKGYPKISKTVDIVILPPWYLSGVMKVFYFLIVLALFYALTLYQKNKARKEKAKLQAHLIKEAKQELQRLEKNNLIKEVKVKKKELSNTTASVIQKNETIILLINELNRLKNSSPDLLRTKKIIQKSKSQLDNQKDWKLFESNFNDLNEDFFKSLSSKFPKMTSKDLRLCAYIKIGLTSKEIAPLMGITTRGVELHRYRLRKKLNFDANISYNEFLSRF